MNADDAQVVGLTLGTATLSTLIIFPFGVALAWLLARKNWPGKSLVETIVALPLVMPPVATGLILLNLLGRRGPIGAFLQNAFGTEIVFTWKAVVAAMAVMSFLFWCGRFAWHSRKSIRVSNRSHGRSAPVAPVSS